MADITINNALASALMFALEGEVCEAIRFGSGHINDTFRIETTATGTVSYLLQRINHHIFTDVDGLMHNTKLVIDHLKRKLLLVGPEAAEKGTLTLIPTRHGENYYKDEHGDYWRMFILLTDTKSYDIVETPKQAFAGGAAFGKFQKQLADLDARTLVEVLPNFHNIEFRMNNLKTAIAADAASRVVEVQDLLDFIFEREAKMGTILEMAQRKELPLRITHNDTKFNNVLLDQEDNVQCVIDLDTVMPGFVAYDFGDAIRTIINRAAEDEADPAKITLNIPLYQAYTEGYLSEAREFLTVKEVESLIHGVFLLPFMQAVRFLTDYIAGDTYYKIHYPNHNLVRTHAQLKLVQELELHEAELRSILEMNIQA